MKLVFHITYDDVVFNSTRSMTQVQASELSTFSLLLTISILDRRTKSDNSQWLEARNWRPKNENQKETGDRRAKSDFRWTQWIEQMLDFMRSTQHSILLEQKPLRP